MNVNCRTVRRCVLALATSLALGSSGAALAHAEHGHSPAHTHHSPTVAGSMRIEQPWSRPTVAAVPVGVVYVHLTNTGTRTDRLLSASSTVAERVELHTSFMDGNLMRMRQLAAVDIAPASTAHLEPGGMHIMLMGLKAPLTQGQTFALTLVFEQAGAVTVQVPVRDPVDSAAEHGDSHGAHGGHGGPHGSGHKH